MQKRACQVIIRASEARFFSIFILLGIFLSCGPAQANEMLPLGQKIEFNKHIRPILADHCYHCHGPDKGTRQAGLRLDERETAIGGGAHGEPAIIPGNSMASELVKRIISPDPDYRMPKPEAGPALPQAAINRIKQWIDQGAEYEPHWAYVAPHKEELPAVKNSAWSHNAVDRFVLAKLEQQGLQPAPEADRRTLIRRLTFDLLGLPPTPEEVEIFLGDTAPQAYERLVDRLLASPHYGERMAVYWLDLVRYADTVGYHGDQNIDVWPYRDYVIRAFNDNMPFDQFTREQLAGDLLPNATQRQKVASAYNRLNMVTREGGAQAKEYLAKYAADRVRTTSTVWMASSLGCAECHDHKFDPFTAKDFYRFAAFFADVKEEGVYESSGFYDAFPPTMRLTNQDQAEKLTQLTNRFAQVSQEVLHLQQLITNLHASRFSLDEAHQRSASALGMRPEALANSLTEWETTSRERIRQSKVMEMALIIEDDSRGGKKEGEWRLQDKADGSPTHSGKRVREQSADGLVQHVANGFAKPHVLRPGDRLYAYVYTDPRNQPATLMLQWDTGRSQWNHRTYWGQDLIPYGKKGQDSPDHRHLGDLPAAGKWVRLEIDPEKVGLKAGDEIRGLAFTQHGGRAWWDDAGVISRDIPPDEVIAILAKTADSWRDSDHQLLLASYLAECFLKKAEAQLAGAKQAKEEFEKTLPLCVVTESVQPRAMRILPRGNWMDESGEVVHPGVPQFLMPRLTEGGQRLTRLDLAHWLTDPHHPLTARVMVNRLWKLCFGTGLSKTLDDLGSRGEWPRHLDLLDWLAVEFREKGWDVKHMMRLLVTSAAYRQSSKPEKGLMEVDPYNRLFARQSRWRLEAEFVRDQALLISGLFVPEVGGPSVKPYQPSDYYKELNFPKRTYTPDRGKDQYRRGLYTHWQRTFLHPSLSAFDAPSREECTAERNISNTPLQALALLNDPTYVEAARILAQNTLEQGGASFQERLHWVFRRALSREPSPREEATLKAFFEQQSSAFQSHPESAAKLIQAGYAPVPGQINPTELAVWTSVGRCLLNLHETITRY